MKFTCFIFLLACIVIAIEAKAIKSCTCTVPFVRKPVCGSDGNTYESKYAVDCHNICQEADVKISHAGTCKDHKPRKEQKKKDKSKEKV